MLDEEYFAEDAKAGEEKVHIEINKYKLPEYKRIAGLKKDFPLQEVFHDDFLVKEIEEVDKKVLKTPKDEKDYLDNLKNQEEQAKTEIETPTEEGGEETETETAEA